MVAIFLLIALLAPTDQLDSELRGTAQLRTDVDAAARDEIFRIAAQTDAQASAVLGKLGFTRRSNAPAQLRIYAGLDAFEDFKRRTRDAYTPIDDPSFYNAHDDEVVCAWQDGSAAAVGQLRRQISRHVLSQHAKEPPNWFAEGFSRYIEGVRADPFGEPMTTLALDYFERVRADLEKETVCPLETLMELKDVDFYGFAGARNAKWSRPTLYAQSWSLLYFILRAEAADDAAMHAFVELLVARATSGRWKAAPLKRALPALSGGWRGMLASDDLDLIGGFIAKAWEALAEDDAATARMRASRALSFDEENRSARRALAHACFACRDYANAALSFERLLVTTPDDLDALLGVARSRLNIALTSQSPADAEAAILAGRSAADLAPPAQQHLGLGLCTDAAMILGDAPRALTFVREALRLRSLPQDARAALVDREQELIRRAIGK